MPGATIELDDEKRDIFYSEYLNEVLKLVFGGENCTLYYTSMCEFKLPKEKLYNFTREGDTYYMYPTDDLKEKKPGLKKYKSVGNYSCGFALVEAKTQDYKVKEKYNFVDLDLKELRKEWFVYARDFSDGFACVGKIIDGKIHYNYLNTSGEFICDEWLDVERADDFFNGFARITKNGRQRVINSKGKYISKKWYDKIYNFYEGYALVEDGGQYNIIDVEGNLVSDEWFARIDHDSDGKIFNCDDCAVVYRQNGQFNYMSKYGRFEYSTEWFSIEHDESNKYYFRSGKHVVDNMYYDQIYPFCNGVRMVRNGRFYSYVNKSCHLITKGWLYGGRELIDEPEKFYFDKNGWGLAQKPIFRFGKEKIVKKWKCNYINSYGKYMKKKWADVVYSSYNEFMYVFDFGPDKKEIGYEKDLKNYKVKKTLSGKYKCISPDGTTKFKLDYEPLIILNKNNVICIKDDYRLYSYDDRKKEYSFLSIMPHYHIMYDHYFLALWDYDSMDIYLICDDKLIDISNYFKKNLVGKKSIDINTSIELLTEPEFEKLSKKQKEELMNKLMGKTTKLTEENEKTKYENELKKQIEESKIEQENLNRNYIRELETYSNSLNKLLELRARLKNIPKKKCRPDYMFETIGDHKEMPSIVVMGLPIIDLSIVSFKGVKISGVDFTGTNIKLDPQEVYKKNLKNCNFTGVYLDPLINFNGSDIRGAKFSADNNPATIDLMPRFKKAIYDEYTTYNGVSLVEMLGPCQNIIEEDKQNRRKI